MHRINVGGLSILMSVTTHTQTVAVAVAWPSAAESAMSAQAVAATSSSSAKDIVVCPSCQKSFEYGQLNTHLDRCLGIDEGVASSARATPAFSTLKRPNEISRSSEKECTIASQLNETPSKKRKALEDAGPAPPIASSSRERLDSVAPLAERLRPKTLDDFVGQKGVIEGPLKALLAKGIVPNAILWGPPGTGKTTLARILARTSSKTQQQQQHGTTSYRFIELSATTASSNDIKKIFEESASRLQLANQRTILFIDEIQRFSRAQQDVFLPAIEKGTCILIAATTENPSFRLQSALLSRMRVFVLTKLSIDECFQVLQRARQRIQDSERTSGGASVPYEQFIDDAILQWIATMADGDARTALGALEIALATLDKDMTSSERLESLKTNLKRTTLQYDRTGDHHYDTISALHKSIRGSNADAALYWLARMIESGDDPLFVARRLIVAASEDCNTLAALQMATSTYAACQVVGLPECAENLAQCVVFLAESPKSTRAYRGWKKAQNLVRESYNYPVPIHIRNAPTRLMREMGHGKEYRYEPSFAHPVVQEYFPPELQGTRLLSPPPEAEHKDNSGGVAYDEDRTAVTSAAVPVPSAIMTKANGIGPGACQRIFKIGSRSIDLDMLEEWERERNDGQPWSGRTRLMQQLASAEANSLAAPEEDSAAQD